MRPWANYTFRVIARNKIGPSLPSSHSSVCRTDPDVPSKNPENVLVRGTEPTNLVISWTVIIEVLFLHFFSVYFFVSVKKKQSKK